MATGSTGVIEIKGSRAKLLLLFILGAAMTAGCAFVLTLDNGPQMSMSSLKAQFAGYVGTPFFALCTVVSLWRLLTAARPVVTITPTGITDTRVAAREIPWAQISDVGTWSHRGQKFVILRVADAVEANLQLTLITRMTRRANASIGADGLCITAQGLQTKYQALYDAIVAHVQQVQAGR